MNVSTLTSFITSTNNIASTNVTMICVHLLHTYIPQIKDTVVNVMLPSVISWWWLGKLCVLDKFTIYRLCQIGHQTYPWQVIHLTIAQLLSITTLHRLSRRWFTVAFFSFGEGYRKSLLCQSVQCYRWQQLLKKLKIKYEYNI